jgi:hypothetical protein
MTKNKNMINLETLVISKETTTVLPSDNLFKELGNNTYNLVDLLSELVDNCIAARCDDKKLNVKLTFFVDEENQPIEFSITDNAKGIRKKDLGVCISPAARQTFEKLNEHGLGMKQAIGAMGELKFLATKTSEDSQGTLVKKFNFGEIDTYHVDMDMESGTIIRVQNLTSLISTDTPSIRNLKLYLGARYRRYLKPGDKVMDLFIEKRNIHTEEIIELIEVSEVKPIYFHPGNRTNAPVIQNYEISGAGWSAEITFGYAPKSKEEYQELGIMMPKNYHPYNVSLPKQGLDIILQDRVVLFSQLSDKDFGVGLGIVSKPHPNYNLLRGEIVLKKGFRTAITKNSMISDENYRECILKVKRILEGTDPGPKNKTKQYLRIQTSPEDLPESLLRDRLAEWLGTNPLNPKQKINKEYSIQGVEGYIDILADNEVWELKVHQASGLDVYQLFMYMDVADFTKGYLIAKSFSPGAKQAVDHIKNKHGKEILLSELSKFPINDPPTTQERENYY